jgi:hypothetical protein
MTVEEANISGIAVAHEAFERLTGKQYMLHPARKFAWEKFLVVRRFTVEDIGVVVKYLQEEIAAKRAYPPQLWWNNLIEQPDRFEEYLNDAKAKNRNAVPVKTNKDVVLEVSGRPRESKQSEINVISMNDRVKWHLEQMRKAIK